MFPHFVFIDLEHADNELLWHTVTIRTRTTRFQCTDRTLEERKKSSLFLSPLPLTFSTLVSSTCCIFLVNKHILFEDVTKWKVSLFYFVCQQTTSIYRQWKGQVHRYFLTISSVVPQFHLICLRIFFIDVACQSYILKY